MCSVIGCKTSLGSGMAECFRLPGDPERRLEWVQFLATTNGQTFRESSWTDMSVCSDHFTEDCFENLNQIRMGFAGTLLLKSTAAPSLYRPSSQPEVHRPPTVKQPLKGRTTDVGCQCDDLVTSCSRSTSCPEESMLLSKGVQVNPMSCGVSVSCSTDVSSPVTFEETLPQQQRMNREDLIKEKFMLLQKKGKHIVNESCLLQLFRRYCPSCGSSCKLEKILYGSLIIMNQQCIKCEYKFQWKSQVKASLPTAQGQQQTGDTESTAQSHQEELHQTAPLDDGSNHSSVPVIVSEVIAFSDEEHNSSDEDRDDDDGGGVDMKSSFRDDDYDPSDDLTDFGSNSDMETEIPEDNSTGHDERELCSECGTFFNTLKPHTCEYKIKPYSCNVCGKRFTKELSVQIHSAIHKDTYLHPCKFCLKTFKTRVDKITHERTHPATKTPYQCPDCPELFAQLHDRNKHVRGHRGTKKYTCCFCKLEFLCETQLLRHERVHTGVKPFVCEVCQRSFNQRGHLKSHMRLHTGERPYKCPHCDKSFNHNISRKNHVQRYHSGVPDSGHKQFGADKKKDKSSTDDAEERGFSDTVIDPGFKLEVDDEEEEKTEENSASKTFRRRATGRPKGRPGRKNRLIKSMSTATESDKSETGHLKKTSFASDESEEEKRDTPPVTIETTEKDGKNLRKNAGRRRMNISEDEEYDSDSDFDPAEQKKRKTGGGRGRKNTGKSRGNRRK